MRLIETDSHEFLDARLGNCHYGELMLAAAPRGLYHSITLFDRAYFSAVFLMDWQQAGVAARLFSPGKINI